MFLSPSQITVLPLVCAALTADSPNVITRSAKILSLLAAIRQVESSGNDRAVGDHGRAKGPFQIHRPYWLRAVKGTAAERWDYDIDVWKPDRAAQVVLLHWDKTCPAALNLPNLELLARSHRLPFDPYRKSNDAYWAKVKKALKEYQ